MTTYRNRTAELVARIRINADTEMLAHETTQGPVTMLACDIDDMVLELSRLARQASEKMMKERAAAQLGEAFIGLEQ